jgi:hypothetical protein
VYSDGTIGGRGDRWAFVGAEWRGQGRPRCLRSSRPPAIIINNIIIIIAVNTRRLVQVRKFGS